MTTRKVPLMEGETIYMGWGHLFPAGCLVISAIGGILLLVFRRRGSTAG
jgi:apolipoprotein N-acyltransferase